MLPVVRFPLRTRPGFETNGQRITDYASAPQVDCGCTAWLRDAVRILLISPTHSNADGTLHKTTRYWTSGITLPYMKALTPPGHDVQMVDELFHDVDLEFD